MNLPDRFSRTPYRPPAMPLEAYGMPPVYPAAADSNDFLNTIRKLWRQRYIILAAVLICGIAGIVAVRQIPDYYIAEARIQVGVPLLRVLNIEAMITDASPDAERIQNEAYILQSREVAGAVAEELGLVDNPEFNPALWEPGLIDSVRVYAGNLIGELQRYLPWLSGEAEDAAVDDTAMLAGGRGEIDDVTDILLSRLEVSTLGRSHILSVEARSTDPDMAAAIANTFADKYLARQRQDKISASEEAEAFLAQRIQELRQQVERSDRAVEEYRRANGLYKGAAVGVTAQQLTELNTQLILAQTAKAEADSRLGEARTLRQSGIDGESVPDVLRSALIGSLKQQQAEAEGRLDELSGRFGRQHPRMISARAEVNGIREKVRVEIGRIIQGLQHEARSTNARYEALRQNFERLKAQAGGVNEKSIQLAALEREAAVNHNLLEQMMGRAKETIGQERLQKANARLVSAAAPPAFPGFPPRNLVMFLCFLAGGLLGVVIAFLRDSIDFSFRRGDQVETATGLPVLAMVPALPGRMTPIAHVLRKPVSPYNEALRKLHIGLELSEAARSPKTVLFGSAVPGEGKSMLVGSLGRMLASQGRRILIIDCDWRSPRMHKLFRCGNRIGLAQLLGSEDHAIESCIFTDTLSGVDIIPAGMFTAQAMRNLTGERMRQLLETLSERYDLVILDTAPVLVGAEVLTLARMVDKVAFTIRWGRTRRETALEALKEIIDVHGDVAGIVMTCVDPKGYRKYAYSKLIYEYERPLLVKPAEWG